MTRPRLRLLLRSRCWIPLGVLLLPPLAWTLVLAVMPTGWARSRVVARLEAATGRTVTLGSLRVGPLGGLTLGDLTVASPTTPADPWLRVGRARVDVSLGQLLFGRIDPSELTVEGLSLRVHRRADGSSELTEANPPAAPTGDTASRGDDSEPTSLRFHLTNARITVDDEPCRTRLELGDVDGRGVWEGKKTTIEGLRGALNGGAVALAAQLDRTGPKPSYEGQLRVEQGALDAAQGLLRYVAPVGAGAASGLEGKFDLSVYLRGTGTGRDDLRRSVVGQGTVALDPVRLDGVPLVADLAAALNLPATGHVGAVRSTFAVKDGRVRSDDLTLDFARLPVVLSGWTDFDGRLDYRLKAERRVPGAAREVLSELGVDPDGDGAVEITGDLDRAGLTVDGRPLRETLGTPLARGRKLRDLSRKLRERVLR